MTCKWFECKCDQVSSCDGKNLDNCPEFLTVGKLMSKGHTRHCACRILWGDGECGCGWIKNIGEGEDA